MEEIWKDIEETKGAYQVSNLGNVKNSKFDRILKPGKRVDGYLAVKLFISKNNILSRQIHRLVAQAFLPNPDNLLCVMHLNDTRSDNKASNLKWGSHKDNTGDMYKKGRDYSYIKQMKARIEELEKELNLYKEKFGSLKKIT